jgi:hypothetical protein
MPASATSAAAVLLASSIAVSAFAVPACADPIADWTAKAHAIAAEQRCTPLARARMLAILHVAIFETVDALEQAGTQHRLGLRAKPDTSLDAATAAAAHDVLVALYPDRAPDLSPTLAASLARIANDVPKVRGFALGKNTATAVLARWLPAPAGKEMGHQIGGLSGDPHP